MTRPQSSQEVQTLEYGRETRRFWRRHPVAIAIVALALVASGVVFALRHQIGRRTMELYWAYRCANFTAPPAMPRVVYQTHDLAWASTSRDYVPRDKRGRPPTTQKVLLFQPLCWRELASRSGVVQPYHFFSESTLFLGELRTPSGKRRIVHVEALGSNMLRPNRELLPTIVEPPTLLSPPRTILEHRGGYAASGRFVPGIFHIGQRDPNDASHFTIAVQTLESWDIGDRVAMFPKRSGIIDGYLGDDDRITFKLRDPASTQGL